MPAIHPFVSLVDALEGHVSRGPERRFARFLDGGDVHAPGTVWDYGTLWARTAAVAAHLRDRVQPGERVLLMLPQGLDYIAAFYGCFAAGVIAVPAYPPDPSQLQRTLPRLLGIAGDARPTVGLTTAEFVPLARALSQGTAELGAVEWSGVDGLPDAPPSWAPHAARPEQPAFLQYTSGSTRTPKGVVVTHGNLAAHMQMIHREFRLDDGTMVSWLPMFHDMGLIGMVLAPAWGGRSSIYMSPVDFLRRPARWLEAISLAGRDGAVVSGGPDFAYALCARKVSDADRAALDLGPWRLAYSGAEPVRAQTLDAFVDRFAPSGFRRAALFPTYGLAEATLMASGGPSAEPPRVRSFDAEALARSTVSEGSRRLVACGRDALDSELLVVEPATGRPTDGVGEIWIRGPHVAAGYWGQPEQTRETFGARLEDGRGPFLRTGDLGFTRDGQLYVLGRMGDRLVIRGRNVHPEDVEVTVEAVDRSIRPGCAVVFAVEHGGEARMVVVAERTGSDDPAALATRVTGAVSAAHGGAAVAGGLRRPAGPAQDVERQAHARRRAPGVARRRARAARRRGAPARARARAPARRGRPAGGRPAGGGRAEVARRLDARAARAVAGRPRRQLLRSRRRLGARRRAGRRSERSPGPGAAGRALLRARRRPGRRRARVGRGRPRRRRSARRRRAGRGGAAARRRAPAGAGHAPRRALADPLRHRGHRLSGRVGARRAARTHRRRSAVPRAGRGPRGGAGPDPAQPGAVRPVVAGARPPAAPARWRSGRAALRVVGGALRRHRPPAHRHRARRGPGGLGPPVRRAGPGQRRRHPDRDRSGVPRRRGAGARDLQPRGAPHRPVAAGGVPRARPAERGSPAAAGILPDEVRRRRAARRGRARGLPVALYRPGFITGDSVEGREPAGHSQLRSDFLTGCLAMGRAPRLSKALDVVPVDFVARAIVALMLERPCAQPAWVLLNPAPLAQDRYYDLVRRYGYALEAVPYGQWRDAVLDLPADSDNPLVAFRPWYRTLTPHRMYRFETLMSERMPVGDAETRRALDALGVSCPPFDAELVHTYLEAAVRRGRVPPPPGQRPDGPLRRPQGGPVAVAGDTTHFTDDYDEGPLSGLYAKAKGRQWDAAKQLDWSIDLDPENPQELPDEAFPLFGSPVWQRLNRRERASLRHHHQAWQLSQFLHGEQGALLCASKLVQQMPTMDAKLCASMQVVDEARHVEAFGRMVDEKMELRYPVCRPLERLLGDVISDRRWDMTLLGMQVLVEGLALAAFATCGGSRATRWWCSSTAT